VIPELVVIVATFVAGCASAPAPVVPSCEVRRCATSDECAAAQTRERGLAAALQWANASEAPAREAAETQARNDEAEAARIEKGKRDREFFLEEQRKAEARFREGCDADRADRARQHHDNDVRADLIASARRAELAEAERLRTYQKTHCRKVTTELPVDRVPCDDGSGYVRMCDVYPGRLETSYVCPKSAPEAIRGDHELAPDPYDPNRPMPRGARVARDVGEGRAPPKTALEERDQQCAAFDAESSVDGGAP
jgi:hypothetical protein